MTAFSAMDHGHMAHALRLAELGLYTTQPNPRVGCIIAHGERVVGAGWHQRAGEPHAEVFALREAGERARSATAYVTLEPCAHHGRTPPCAEALIAAGVARVVIAAEDPFPQVAGRGIAMLREAGISVENGLMRDAARELNIGFFSRIERGRPWLRIKLAMSLDGRTALANGESKWITGEAARADVQRWRARSSAILTGSGTVLADNPRLTVRLPDDQAFTPPLRVVLDRQRRTPAGSHVRDGSVPTLILHSATIDDSADEGGEPSSPSEYLFVPEQGNALDLKAALTLLAERGCNEVQVEAGPVLCGALFAAGLVDELLLYIAPLLLGDSARPLLHLPSLDDMAHRWKLQTIEHRQIGEDWRLRLRPAISI
ncbi:bifunctional diaminohydroxyphosphoribosylaminopyrimidine deaminase/5-amino-6-(5-phosphoribosylamino)uracil reductase RibD [Rhodanobacter sp. A1T4]|uniref:bifunctional diaminohydroxyphosphoribosylaminopyrimidine deaminase/5-amino-6-(5-phosphoribosylamino)uracil reductase RibD n=1 Tax=Rhodanobacter sp. A1T4 TaxID=2723087 RepID=UPI0017BD9FFE|nr:bifunctional diaminohydroxyphosphoribosylaminopyrimidine deaminase/5-amino-6-(5-phosphoribosylamino)uracil reductase RibD [Rhodanobacter sp. A1T4]MBB6245345.1 diaminohydroxyphosphoribosylaminopyrimidine deaminase/5-amino-6-(5-phosphoribosylamino)uracil reductase [Rhodanobacter sp. A1T4]